MISLPKLLLEAAGRKASEVVLEVGERPSLTTPTGHESFGDRLDEGDLFEALTGVLAPDQQAELAVGNMVEFRVSHPSGEWTLVVEPSLDGMVVRGRRGNGAAKRDPEVGTPMDLPPLAPFQPDPHGEAPAPEPVLKRRTQVDLGLAAYAQDDPPWGRPAEPLPPVPQRSTTPTGEGVSPLPPPPPVAGLGPSRDSGVDFAIVPDSEPALELDTDVHRPAFGSAPPTPPTPAQGVPRRPAARGPATRDERGPLLSRIEQGTLCFVNDRGLGEQIAHERGEAVTVLDEPRAVDLAGRMLDELPHGMTYLVRLEDPSRITAWVLRRLEEGSRVIVETRARDIDGAQRIFLGLNGEPAARWLSAHPVVWLADDGGRGRIDAAPSDRSDSFSPAPSGSLSASPSGSRAHGEPEATEQSAPV